MSAITTQRGQITRIGPRCSLMDVSGPGMALFRRCSPILSTILTGRAILHRFLGSILTARVDVR